MGDRPQKRTPRRWVGRLVVAVCLIVVGIWFDVAFNLAEKIVLLENQWFHEEVLQVDPPHWDVVNEERAIYRLEIEAHVRFTAKPAYTLRVTFPSAFALINRAEFELAAKRKSAAETQIRTSIDHRRYRDLEHTLVLFLYPDDASSGGPVTVELLDGDRILARRTLLQLQVRKAKGIAAFEAADRTR